MMRSTFGGRNAWVGLIPTRLRQLQNRRRPFSSSNNGDKVDDGGLSRQDAYRQLDNLDFMTAAKILFISPPKQKKFGLDFHLVQLFFVCMPSLAVYLVAQYARYEMRRMEAELEVKTKAEEAKTKEMELKAAEEKEAASDPELQEVKERLGKLEEAVKEMVVMGSKNPPETPVAQKKDGDGTKPSAITSAEASNSTAEDQTAKGRTEGSAQLGRTGSAPVTDAFQQNKKTIQAKGP